MLLHQEIAAIKEQLDKEKKELLETTNMEAAEKDKISKELGYFIYSLFVTKNRYFSREKRRSYIPMPLTNYECRQTAR